jgi:hypothetical protein
MATVTKDFRVKAGLVVEGSTATVNSHDILTEALVDAKGDLLVASGADAVTRLAVGTDNYILTADSNATNGVKWAAPQAVGVFGESITFEGATADAYETTLEAGDPTADRTITLPNATGTVALTSDITSAVDAITTSVIEEGTNLYFTDERAQDAIGNNVGTGLTYTDSTGAISVTANTYDAYGSASTVAGNLTTHTSATEAHGATGAVVGTTNTQTLTNKTLTSPVVSGLTLSDGSIVLEGATADAHETTITVTDPTADRTITLPDATGTVALTNNKLSAFAATSSSELAGVISDETGSGALVFATSPTISGLTLSDGSIVFEGATADEFETSLAVTDPTADRTITIPDITGTLITTGDTGSVTNTMLAGSIANNKLSNSAVTINGTSVSLGSSATLYTDDISEDGSPTNLWFTDERAQDAVGNSVGNGLDYDDSSGAISVDPAEFKLNAIGVPDAAVSLNSQKITNLANPTDSSDAANKAYVDSVVEGLHVHESVVAATTANVNLSNALENGDTLDGITLATGNRILVKNQTTQSENGIYVVQASGQPTRATDFDTATEVDSGDFVFVYSGTVNGATSWVQTNKPATIGTDAINFTQFSGAGTYLAGDGLLLTGTTFSVNAGTGISIVSDNVTNTGVLSITGTANQITASASTGAITLSGPQDLHSSATPTFGGVTAGSLTLADALVGSALATASDSATTIDSWSATTYSSAKYIIQMKKSGNIEVIEMLVTVDGSNNVYVTEYADIISNTELGTTNAVYSGGNVLLQVTGASADTSVKVHKVYIEA